MANTLFTQPSVFAVSVAFYEYYKDLLPVPHFMAGHSLGEFSALVCSGALHFRDAIAIIQTRAKLMAESVLEGEGTMSAINGLPSHAVAAICDQLNTEKMPVSVAAFNTPSQTVVSGNTRAVAEVENECSKKGAEVVRLKVSAPFHSCLMRQAGIELNKELSRYTYNTPTCKIISNVTGRPYDSKEDFVINLTHQMTQPIRWQHSMEYLTQQNTYFFVELGPGKTLRNFMRNAKGIRGFAMDDEKDIDLLRQSVAENIPSLSTIVTKSLAIAVSIRNNNDDEAAYQKGVVESFRTISKIQSTLEAKKKMPDSNDIVQAVEMLCRVMKAKKMKHEDAQARFEQLFEDTGSLHLMPALRKYLH
jgi:[acyl-carrier-protein] S-malonyltransferase